jgi:hypothetical protein
MVRRKTGVKLEREEGGEKVGVIRGKGRNCKPENKWRREGGEAEGGRKGRNENENSRRKRGRGRLEWGREVGGKTGRNGKE